jgi:hypothetical protein
MTITIQSNGSKWAGEQPDSIEELIQVLGQYVLSRIHEPFIETPKAGECWAEQGTTRFSGNFYELSHVFSIDTDDPELIERLTTAINANIGRPDYQAQPSIEQRRLADEEYRRARDAERDAQRQQAARRILGLEA